MRTKIYEAVAHALNDIGADVVTHVPGFGASEVYQSFNLIKMRNSPEYFNEEVAYAVAFGASIAGKRSASLMKAHGFMKAANAATDSLYANTNAGFVTIIFEDKEGSHSDNVLEIKPILKALNFPYKTCTEKDVYENVIKAFLVSEKKQMPVVLLVDSADIDKEIEFEQQLNLKKNFEFHRDILSHFVSPLFSKYQYKIFTAKTLGGDLSIIQKPILPVIPNDIPERYKDSVEKYIPLFDVFKYLRGEIVCGDTSTSSFFALPPYNCIDTVLHIGGSIPMAIGASLAGKKNVWALTGDFGFIAAGHMALIEAVQREVPIKVIIFYNKKAAATGGQTISKQIMYKLLAGYEKNLRHISNTQDTFEINEVLTEVSDSDELRIVLADY